MNDAAPLSPAKVVAEPKGLGFTKWESRGHIRSGIGSSRRKRKTVTLGLTRAKLHVVRQPESYKKDARSPFASILPR